MPIELKEKIALFCDVPPSAVVQNGDAETIYQVPLNLEAEGLAAGGGAQTRTFRPCAPRLDEWGAIAERMLHPQRRVTIALVGKYVELKDAYIRSTKRSITPACFTTPPSISSASTRSHRRTKASKCCAASHGILVAPGFGARGVKGKLRAIQYARERKIPFLGICLRHAARVRRVCP